MILPKLGDSVLYFPSELDLEGGEVPPMEVADKDCPVVAFVCNIRGNGLLNLVIFDCEGTMFRKYGITLVPDALKLAGKTDEAGDGFAQFAV